MEGDLRHVFGLVADAAVAGNGEVYVLDGIGMNLRMFDHRGDFVAGVGRRGDGPGEFRNPVAVSLDETGSIYVLDSGNQRISTFRYDAGALRLVRTTNLSLPARDLCVSGGRTFVLAYHRDRLVHELDYDGTVLRSFAPPEDPTRSLLAKVGAGGSILRQHYNLARIVCPTSGEIIVVHENIPVIAAYRQAGHPIWRVELEGVESNTWDKSVHGPGIVPRPNPRTGRFTTLSGAVEREGQVTVTVRSFQPGAPGAVATQRVIRVRDGSEVARRSGAGSLIGLARGLQYFVLHDPYPHILVR